MHRQKKSTNTGPQKNKKIKSTSWGGVSDWYHGTVTNEDSYQKQVIEPNIRRILGNINGKKVLDLACGEGYFSRQLKDAGAIVTGVDIGKELISIAKKHDTDSTYIVSESHMLDNFSVNSFDTIVCILALQNIEKIKETFQALSRVLKPGGKFVFVINHPSFRNPQKSDWGFDEATNKQYRKVFEYMTEAKIIIDMTPGERNKYKKKHTISFHRPLQFFVKELAKNSMATIGLEEWVSHKESKGKRGDAENKARHEIPMFMCIVAQKKPTGLRG